MITQSRKKTNKRQKGAKTMKKVSKVYREYKVVYYNPNKEGLGCIRVPWFKYACGIQDARRIKRNLENQGYVDVDIIMYDTTMYKMS